MFSVLFYEIGVHHLVAKIVRPGFLFGRGYFIFFGLGGSGFKDGHGGFFEDQLSFILPEYRVPPPDSQTEIRVSLPTEL